MNTDYFLAPMSPPPCRGITSDLAGVVCQLSRMASSSIRARVGVETLSTHRVNPHPNLPPARGKELAVLRVFVQRNRT